MTQHKVRMGIPCLESLQKLISHRAWWLCFSDTTPDGEGYLREDYEQELRLAALHVFQKSAHATALANTVVQRRYVDFLRRRKTRQELRNREFGASPCWRPEAVSTDTALLENASCISLLERRLSAHEMQILRKFSHEACRKDPKVSAALQRAREVLEANHVRSAD